MRVKSNNVTILAMYPKFKEEYGIDISYQDFRAICYSFNKRIASKIINEGKTFRTPFRLGPLAIQKNKMSYNKLSFDYQEWKKSGLKTYILNEHSNEYVAKCYWLKKFCLVKNKRVYNFKMVRGNNRAIADVMKRNNGHHIYQIKEYELKK